MTALVTIAPRLAQLIPLLASDKDGEVVATARAIGRTLKQAGSDFHDLAATLRSMPATRVTAASSHTHASPRCWDDICREDQDNWLWSMSVSGSLTSWERNFAASILSHLAGQRWRMLSLKQVAVLDRLVCKLVEAR